VVQSARTDREQILRAGREILVERGAGGLSVSAVMERARISRTVFYRRFPDVSEVVAELLRGVCAELAVRSGAWFIDPAAVGSREVVVPNSIEFAAALHPHASLLCAISDAAGSDGHLRALWWSELLQPRVDATAAAIRRDQEAGAVRPELDAEATAFALTLMGERVVLELLGRRGGTPEEFARMIGPIWEATLFGVEESDP
jgi:AcrR family transcriptional regulator